MSLLLFSGLSNAEIVPGLLFSSFANASSVGANTVRGPFPFNASTRPAAFRADTRVLNLPAETAVSTISLASILDPDEANATERVTAVAAANEMSLVSFIVNLFEK